jgi:hypothetical protein
LSTAGKAGAAATVDAVPASEDATLLEKPPSVVGLAGVFWHAVSAAHAKATRIMRRIDAP